MNLTALRPRSTRGFGAEGRGLRAYDRAMVELRPMRVDDVPWIERWDDDPEVAAALGDPAADWYDWPTEIERVVSWRELLIAEENGRPIGFVQLLDAHGDDEQYWGDVEPDTWAIDIWIGAPADRGRGLGAQTMQAALDRVFDERGASTVVIDPRVTNQRAIDFYRRQGFEPVGERFFGDDHCLVMAFERWS